MGEGGVRGRKSQAVLPSHPDHPLPSFPYPPGASSLLPWLLCILQIRTQRTPLSQPSCLSPSNGEFFWRAGVACTGLRICTVVNE